LGPLAASVLEHASASSSKRTRSKAMIETGGDSELARARIKAVEWILSINSGPMNAPEVSTQVKDDPSFYTKAGDPVHIVRRVLADGVQEGVFLKTAGGLFTTHQDSRLPKRKDLMPTGDDDLDDPFADN